MNPLLRRIVTGHNAQGRAVVTHDTLLPQKLSPSGVALFSLVWATDKTPVDNNDTTDGGQREVALTVPGGTVLRICDMLPGTRSALHRTNSLDYGIVLKGDLELELDDGAVTLVPEGSVVVQRGTMHAWRNPSSDVTARIAFVLVDAEAVQVDGVPLPEVMPHPASKRN